MNTVYQTDFSLLLEQLASIQASERDTIANLANASALLYMSLKDINWAGFYLVREGQLVLGPFQGKPACIRIDFGKGVCGSAAADGTTLVVPNVHAFAGHIACDGASNSEIVIPIHHAGKLTAVLDIDSPLYERFTQADREGLERFCAVLEKACDWQI
ncbi:GAF domain-containing protein [Acetatifactor aquisgranensis]|uniref:GAF domain-containing protein n=1 Tax=Acetatifactor aquisgranensis TaxID=2941233 RepID=UPI002040EEC6|nr:GAF domain-containing protein [Acetatifactor aquisgranensis]MCI8544155.1 GAF domain-containing protein [Lachnospiraceae bacterium]